jgi:predicted GNAT family N-acyltransferase
MNVLFTDYITPEEYMEFRKAVGWSSFPIEQAAQGLKNSYIFCLRKDGQAIALGRVIWDHGYVVYIADVIVLPEFQGSGYGRMVMEKIMTTINSWLKPDYKVMVTLVAAKGKEEFYEKFGFIKRPNENFGCGMCQWIINEDKG